MKKQKTIRLVYDNIKRGRNDLKSLNKAIKRPKNDILIAIGQLRMLNIIKKEGDNRKK